ncbi:MAG: glycine/betaine transporter ATPase [Gammaproteobacteria bacterium]|nr:glycine/betaine transporter ATPase [Gammaproteobacteria bacterium]
MSERLQLQNLYKVFSNSPEQAMRMLAAGASKEGVFAATGVVVGLNNVSLSVPAGAIYMVMGLSGSGKSTLARCINRLNEPTAGKILLDSRDIVTLSDKELREVRCTRISMVFQHFALLPNRSVIENAEFGLKLRGVALRERRRRAEEVLAIVGLAQWANHLPHELSGGMRQRVGLARALATDADVLIMDEPFGALDPLIRAEMQDELLRLQHSLKKTILFITHDFHEALKLGNRIAIMRDGELVREETPEAIVLDPASEYVAAFTREVDCLRLFDARSIMNQVAPIAEAQGWVIVGHREAADGTSFVVDADARIHGTLTRADLDKVRNGVPANNLMSEAFIAVGSSMKLIEVARRYHAGRPIAVVDDQGKLIGTLAPEQILARIASIAPSTYPTTVGVPNARR